MHRDVSPPYASGDGPCGIASDFLDLVANALVGASRLRVLSEFIVMANTESLTRRVIRGARWSALSNIALRSGSLILGIVLARLLTPSDFGVYAIALAIQTILVNLADFGLAAQLIRTERFEEKAPTVTTLGVFAGCVFALMMAGSAVPLANSLGSPEAAGVIAVLSLSLPLAGLGIVPHAKLTRDFRQRELFAISVADFAIGAVLTIVLIVAGMGPMALAVGRVIAQLVATALQYRLSAVRLVFKFQRRIAIESVRFGMPLAVANVLSWLSLNVDNVIIAKSGSHVALGYYVLAFNVSTWPMSVIGQSLRAVSLPAFAHLRRGSGPAKTNGEHVLPAALNMTWLLATPAGVGLAALSVSLVNLLYGEQWSPAAEVLAALGLFGVLRVVLDMMTSYLVAAGATRPVLLLQVLWIVVLTPVMVVSVERWGVAGGGWAHVGVAALVVLPAYLAVLRRFGVRTWPVLVAMAPPVLAAVPLWIVVRTIGDRAGSPLTAVLLGVPAGGVVYLAVVLPWAINLKRSIAALSSARRTLDDDSPTFAVEPPPDCVIVGSVARTAPEPL